MTHRIEFDPLAEAELQESFDWYEEHQIGVGDRFLAAVERSLVSRHKYFDG